MKFRQKIWALPVSASLVFGLGIAASLTIAVRSTSQLHQLRDSDNRLLETTLQVDRLSDQLDTALEGASMGDSKRMVEAKAHAAAIEQHLAAILATKEFDLPRRGRRPAHLRKVPAPPQAVQCIRRARRLGFDEERR